jgi:hypothetical protein
MMRIAITFGLIAALASAPAATQDDATKTLRAQLRSIRLDIDIQKYSVKELIDFLREVSGLNIVLQSKAAEIPATLTMKAKDVSIQSVLRLLLKPLRIGYTIDSGVLLIVRDAELESQTRLEVIDVRDLLMPIRDFPGVEITLAEDSLGASFSAANDEVSKEFPIVDLVKAHTGGKTWDDNPRASVNLINGLLFVRQSGEVIEQIKRVLDSLRRFK